MRMLDLDAVVCRILLAALLQLFHRLDADGNGALSRNEIREALVLLGCNGDLAALGVLLDELWAQMPKTADDEVSLPDFVQTLQLVAPEAQEVVVSSATASDDSDYSESDDGSELGATANGPFAGSEWMANLSALGRGGRRRDHPAVGARAARDDDSEDSEYDEDPTEHVESAIIRQKYQALVSFSQSILEDNEMLQEATEEWSAKFEEQEDELQALRQQHMRLEQQLVCVRDECSKHEVWSAKDTALVFPVAYVGALSPLSQSVSGCERRSKVSDF